MYNSQQMNFNSDLTGFNNIETQKTNVAAEILNFINTLIDNNTIHNTYFGKFDYVENVENLLSNEICDFTKIKITNKPSFDVIKDIVKDYKTKPLFGYILNKNDNSLSSANYYFYQDLITKSSYLNALYKGFNQLNDDNQKQCFLLKELTIIDPSKKEFNVNDLFDVGYCKLPDKVSPNIKDDELKLANKEIFCYTLIVYECLFQLAISNKNEHVIINILPSNYIESIEHQVKILNYMILKYNKFIKTLTLCIVNCPETYTQHVKDNIFLIHDKKACKDTLDKLSNKF